jgi:hypothetical protein
MHHFDHPGELNHQRRADGQAKSTTTGAVLADIWLQGLQKGSAAKGFKVHSCQCGGRKMSTIPQSDSSRCTEGAQIIDRFRATRRRTLALCEPLTPEDMMVQSTPEASPA